MYTDGRVLVRGIDPTLWADLLVRLKAEGTEIGQWFNAQAAAYVKDASVATWAVRVEQDMRGLRAALKGGR